MLPDFPSVKGQLLKLLMKRVRARTRSLSMPGRTHILHEGDGARIVRPDGSVQVTDLKKLEETIVVKFDEIRAMSLEDIVAKVDAMAESMSRQQFEIAFAEIERAVSEVGNVVKGRGGFTAEGFLDMLSKIWMDFDEAGNPRLPSLYMNPVHENAVNAEKARIEAEPELRKRFEEIIAHKREEWRDREAGRVLVG